jgi:hypothetical protein
VSQVTFDALASSLPVPTLVDLVVTLSTYCAVVRVIGGLDVALEPE